MAMEEFSNDPLAFLVHPEGKKSFLSTTWEKKAAHYSAKKDAPRSQLKDVLDIKHLCSILDEKEEEGQCLRFGIDCCAMAYVDSERSDVGTPGEVLDSKEAMNLYNMGATLQVHQPQRFSDTLWKLCAALESQLGSLVGCNAYITPSGAQGLAPHWDDVSLFVLQTAGSKAWKVYGTMPGCDLPSASSGDISRDSLPEPVLEVTLKVGDVLFIPRGHIHEAVALSDGSSHVTVSTYQQWTWMQMATSVMKAWNVRTSTSQASSDGQHKHCAVMRRNGKCICTISRDCASEMLKLCHHNQEGREPCPEVPLGLRQGLPTSFVFSQSLTTSALASMQAQEEGAPDTKDVVGATPAAAKDVAKTLASALREMAQEIEENPQTTCTASQAMGLAFMKNRLPPHPDQLPPSGKEPTLHSLVCCRKEEAFMLTTDDAREWMHSDQDPGLLAQESDDSEDEDGINFDELMGEEDSDEDEEENEDEDMNMGAADKKQASEKNGQGNEKDSSTAKLSIKSNGKSKGPDADSGSDSDEGEAKKGANGKASKEAFVELDSAAGQSSEDDEDSDAVIDPEELQADMQQFVVLATCLHNDRKMHMIDPRLAAAAEGDGFGGPGNDAMQLESDDEGDEPPDLVPMSTDVEKDAKAELASGSGKKQSKSSKKAEEAAPDFMPQEDLESFGEGSMPWMLDIPMQQAQAVAKLLECVDGKSMKVSSLPLEDDRQKMELALALHQWGALRTLPDQQKAPKKHKGPLPEEKKAPKKQQKGPKTMSQGVVKKSDAKQPVMKGPPPGKKQKHGKKKAGVKH